MATLVQSTRHHLGQSHLHIWVTRQLQLTHPE